MGPVYLRRAADFSSLAALLTDVRREAGAAPSRAALAVAGPVTGDVVQLTNRPWRFSATSLAAETGIREIVLENDVAAVAWALTVLDPSQTAPLTAVAIGGGARVVIAPGTGLGVSALVPVRHGWTAVASEGSHAGLALPHSIAAEDRTALMTLGTGWEDLVSGIGLARLYRALGGSAAVEAPEAVTERAHDREALAVRTVDMFSRLLGAFAGDAVLMFAARGGCYLAGGLLASLGGLFNPAVFLEGLRDKGRFADFMADIPVSRITHPHPALLGLGVLLDKN